MPKTNAISLLRQDHEKVRGLLDRLSATTERALKTRRQLLTKLEHEVKMHARIEEEIFYPSFREAASEKDDIELVAEAKEEHMAAEKVLNDLTRTDPSTISFSGKVKALKELIEHHSREEEHDMFRRAKELMSVEQLQQIGERLLSRKQQIEHGQSWIQHAGAA